MANTYSNYWVKLQKNCAYFETAVRCGAVISDIEDQARSQDLEKGGGGGYFERVRKV